MVSLQQQLVIVMGSVLWIAFGLFVVGIPSTAIAAINQTVRSNDVVHFFIDDGDEEVLLPRKDFMQWFTVDTKLVSDMHYRSEMENINAVSTCPITHPGCRFLQSTRFANHVRKVETVIVRTDDIRRFVQRLANDLHREPVNARFRMRDGHIVVFRPHSNGREVLIDESVVAITHYAQSALQASVPQRIKLPSRIITPTFTTEKSNNLGIKELIGEGRSNFAGSPATRIHNIKTAAAHFNGIILAPGEELSFVNILGPVDATTGYAKELVIKDKQTKPEYGGGICQVSTTLFRSAVFAGLEITQRRNHSYPVKYYQPTGFDATIYIPSPDLRFKNNTAHHILFENFIEGTELVFRIYGTKDGRTVEVKGPFITEKNPDGSMKTYFTQKVTSAGGHVIIDDVFYSNYKSPKDYPHPGDVARQKLTVKPANWSKKQWSMYKRANGL